MGYGHAERNLALIRQLAAETRELLNTLDQLDPEHLAWLREVIGLERQAVHQRWPEPATAQ
jgi:predicted transcriptional regulator